MSENATHIIVHHSIDVSSSLFFSMVCCMILIIIVVIILGFLLGFTVYAVVISRKTQQSLRNQPKKGIPKHRESHLSRNLVEDSSSYNPVGTPASTAQDFDMCPDPNVQSIPLSTFRRHTVNDRAGSTENSADLYDVLFPGKRGHETAYEPPKKLVTFAGQVYASGECSSRTNLVPGPSTSGLTCDDASGSMEWDYFQQDNNTESIQSGESEIKSAQLKTLCWV